MVEICTWDEVFKLRRGNPNVIFLILYWYLFNKPDYQSNITKEMKELKKLKEFEDFIPHSIAEERNITRYIRKMEEYNLIGVKEIVEKRRIYQALSFFYQDVYCVKTPKSRGKMIAEHYKEYEGYLKGMKGYPGDITYDRYAQGCQDIVAKLSSEPRKFMHFLQRKADYITLLELIFDTFVEIDLCDDVTGIRILDIERVREKLISPNSDLEYPDNLEFPNGRKYELDFSMMMSNIIMVQDEYKNIELGVTYFNKETLEFEKY